MLAIRTSMTILPLLLVLGCTPLLQIRTTPPPTEARHHDESPSGECDTGRTAPSEDQRIIEENGNYVLGFAEFTDQGWGYNSRQQIGIIDKRLDQELKSLPANEGLMLIVFVHGWHHNAHDNDCNVVEFRTMLAKAAELYSSSGVVSQRERPDRKTWKGATHAPMKRRVFGVYVGWRGESVDADLLRYTTVIDRGNAAARVAVGSVRELFATLRKHEVASNAGGGESDPRVKSLVIGHSFGGLIAFHALSQALLSELVLTKPQDDQGCVSKRDELGGLPSVPPWPDLVVLINPAFESSRFEALHDVVQGPCNYPRHTRPKLVVVKSDNDEWTGKYFTFARTIETMLHKYDETSGETRQLEGEADVRTPGFMPRYRTHRLCLTDENRAIATFMPDEPSGSTVVRDPFSPVWVVGTQCEIVDGHSGFLYGRKTTPTPQPYLLDWILNVATGDVDRVLGGQCGPWPTVVTCPTSPHSSSPASKP